MIVNILSSIVAYYLIGCNRMYINNTLKKKKTEEPCGDDLLTKNRNIYFTIKKALESDAYYYSEEFKENYNIFIKNSKTKPVGDCFSSVKKQDCGIDCIYTLISSLQKGALGSNKNDNHTSYFTPDESDDFKTYREGSFEGIGVSIFVDENGINIINTINGGPSEKKGILSGDIIIEIDGQSTKGITNKEVIKKLRGKKGSEVKIKIKRKDKEMDYNIVRDKIKISSIIGIQKETIGYIKLNQFTKTSANDLKKIVRDFSDIKGLILDLRDNPGGLLYISAEISDIFLPIGETIVSTDSKKNWGENYRTKEENTDYKGKLIVLINRDSASASEIVSGAIQDLDRGIIMGETSYGKGSVQTILTLPHSSTLKLTFALYKTPSGRIIHNESSFEDIIKLNQLDTKKRENELKKRCGFKKKKTKYLSRDICEKGGITPDIVFIPKYQTISNDIFKSTFSILKSESLLFKYSEIIEKKIKEEYYDEYNVESSFKKFLKSIQTNNIETIINKDKFITWINKLDLKELKKENIEIIGKQWKYFKYHILYFNASIWKKEPTEVVLLIDEIFLEAKKILEGTSNNKDAINLMRKIQDNVSNTFKK
jgi:C-terminal peptidase prc